MGDSPSKSAPSPPPPPPKPPTPPPSPTFREPWRQIHWGDDEDLQYVKNYQLDNKEVTQLRVLLYGPVGNGKSSFINSVSNALQGRMTIPAAASAELSDQSFTKKYETHKIRKEDKGNYFPFAFNDIMGLEEGTGRGLRVDDIKLAMLGHVREGYKLNPVSPLSSSDSGYNPSPSANDRVHVLVCVCSANESQINDLVLKKMREIREAAYDIGIPQLAIITKIDEACEETENDLRKVYRSKHVKKKMCDFSTKVGIPLNCVFAVKNYSEETSIVGEVDTLILNALRMIISFGDDFIDKM